MPVDFRYAWHFATRAYPCQVQWASDTELLARWRAGWTTRQPDRQPAPERALLAVAWRDDSGMHVRLAQSRTGHECLGDALLAMVNWLTLLAPNSQICAQENDTGGEPLVTEQRPCYGPLPRTAQMFLEVTPTIDTAHAP
jgi:hypothetical protein